MGLQVAEAFVKIRPDTKAFGAELKSGVSGDVATLAKTFAGLAIGAAVLKSWRDGVNELKQAAAVSAQTANAIRATGGAANVTAAHVGELAERLSQMSGADDELIQSGTNLILTFKNVVNAGEGVNAILDRATTAALDLSTAGFGSMESASIMLGKALNDPVAGLTALQRAGVTFTAAQKATITSLVETGQTLEAQKVILAEIEAQVGGSAKAFGETLPGQLAKAQVALDNAKGSLIAGFAPAIEIAAKATQGFANWIIGLPGPLSTVASSVIGLGAGFVALARPFNEAITLLGKMRGTTAAATAATTANTAATGANAVALETQAVAVTASSRAMLALRAAMAPLAILATGAAVAWSIWTRRLEQGAKAAAEMGDAVRSGLESAGGIEELSGKVAQVNAAIADMQSDLAGSNAPWDADFRRDLQAGIGELESLRNEYVEVGAEAVTLMQTRGLSAEAAFAEATANHEAAGAMGDFGEAAADALSPMEALAAAMDLAAGATDRARQAQQDLISAYSAQFDPLFGLIDAQTNLADAQAKVNEATVAVQEAETDLAKAHGDTTDEAVTLWEATQDLNAANLDAGKSALGLSTAADNLTLAVRSGATSVAEAKTQLYVWAAQGKITEAQAAALAARIDEAAGAATDLGNALIGLDGQSIDVYFTTHYQVTGSAPQGFVTGGLGPQAEGGIYHADRATTATFGEAGGETAIFIPDKYMTGGRSAATEIPSWPGGGAAGGGDIYNINVGPITGVTGGNAREIGLEVGHGIQNVLARRQLAVAARTG